MGNSIIKLIVLDVDGVLTDGKLFIGSNGDEYKSFHVKDGMGIGLARFLGIKVAFISGRVSESVRKRAKELGVDYLYQGITNKEKVLYDLIKMLDIKLDNVFYMGDDINDLPVIRLVEFSAAPKDAVEIVKKSVDYVCSNIAGNGAVREAIDFILSQYVDYNAFVTKYLSAKVMITQ